jgi:hypothetical protein
MRFCSGLVASRRSRRPLCPIRPRFGADDAAAGAHHARAEPRHADFIGHGSALITAPWWQSQQVTASERTPWARMLPSVIGGGLDSPHAYG